MVQVANHEIIEQDGGGLLATLFLGVFFCIAVNFAMKQSRFGIFGLFQFVSFNSQFKFCSFSDPTGCKHAGSLLLMGGTGTQQLCFLTKRKVS